MNRREADSDLVLAARLLIILGNPFSDLAGGSADYGSVLVS